MKPHKRTAAEMWADPFGWTTEELLELGIDPDAESETLEIEQLSRMAEGMREAVNNGFHRRAA